MLLKSNVKNFKRERKTGEKTHKQEQIKMKYNRLGNVV